MKFAVVIFACVLAAANAQFGQANQGQYFPQRENYQYNKYNQNNRYNNNNNYNRYQNIKPYKPIVSSTPYPRVTFAEAKATVSPSVVNVVKPVAPVFVPAVTPAPIAPVSVPRVVADARSAETLKYGNEINADGTYHYFYETNNGIAAQAQGTPRNFGGNPPVVPDVAQGSFSWISPEGEEIAITYVADENGYHPTGNAIPQPPAIPPQIARALEYIARNAPVSTVYKN
ncbi:larval cuticle protein LCP-22-like [Nymphalis io]|uniref:larval cuticle protein LCP-22-like n=1 Tax=Inachis io TaxID=171585 RepID=UPI002166E5BF|nr:larval cuticle protein LCP-22-like [Nymphalis io]